MTLVCSIVDQEPKEQRPTSSLIGSRAPAPIKNTPAGLLPAYPRLVLYLFKFDGGTPGELVCLWTGANDGP